MSGDVKNDSWIVSYTALAAASSPLGVIAGATAGHALATLVNNWDRTKSFLQFSQIYVKNIILYIW